MNTKKRFIFSQVAIVLNFGFLIAEICESGFKFGYLQSFAVGVLLVILIVEARGE